MPVATAEQVLDHSSREQQSGAMVQVRLRIAAKRTQSVSWCLAWHEGQLVAGAIAVNWRLTKNI